MRHRSEREEFTGSQPASPPALSGLFPTLGPGSHAGHQGKAQHTSRASFGIPLTAEIVMSLFHLQM